MRYLNKPVPNSIFLQPTDPGEMFSIINSLSQNKICGPDNISPYFIRMSASLISVFVLVNYSFTLGIFPDNLKLVKVVPIYKTGNKQIVSNYRPISILSSITKIFEKTNSQEA